MFSPAPLLKAIFKTQPKELGDYPGLGKRLPVWSGGGGCKLGLKFGLNPGRRGPGKGLAGPPWPGPEATDLDFSKEIVETIPSFLILTFAFFSSISSTSRTPWHRPSVKIYDSAGFGGLPGGAASCTMNKACLWPKIVMMPVNSTLGGGGAASSTGGSKSTVWRSKTLRCTITLYGLLEASLPLPLSARRALVAPACIASTAPPIRQLKIFPLVLIDSQYTDFENKHRIQLFVSPWLIDMLRFAWVLNV